MVTDWLPAAAQALTEPALIAIVEAIQRQPIPITFDDSPRDPHSISTAHIHQGQGKPPLLLLHGFDSSLLEFRYLLPLLAKQHQTWAVDLLGFGFTTQSAAIDINPSTIRRHLHSFWSTMINQPVVLIGASMGGAAAIDFALTYPKCVTQLVLISSVGFSGSFPIGRYIFPPFDILGTAWLRLRKQTALNILSASFTPDHKLIDAIRCSLLHQEMPGWSEATIAFTKSGGYSELASRIAQIHQPTLILWGDRDDVLGTADAEKFHRHISCSQLVWVRNCGHAPHLEHPSLTAEQILTFSSNKIRDSSV